jgi:hypothetical protein
MYVGAWCSGNFQQVHMQESVLFFTALQKVKEYAAERGHLPTIISENVEGIRYRRQDAVQVRSLECA